uniref:Uncharacterized protein n=1 Tax=Romanomermis culicivorax TaxID=13658 RepID=A0A915HK38_ROMCU
MPPQRTIRGNQQIEPDRQKQDNDAQQLPTKDIHDTGPAPNQLWRRHEHKCRRIYHRCPQPVSAEDLPVKGFGAS